MILLRCLLVRVFGDRLLIPAGSQVAPFRVPFSILQTPTTSFPPIFNVFETVNTFLIRSKVKFQLSDISNDSLFYMFQGIYEVFIAEGPHS